MRLVPPYALQSQLYDYKSGRSGDETTIESNKGFVTDDTALNVNNNLVGTVYRDTYSSIPLGYLSNMRFDEFVELLKGLHSRTLDCKESSGLVAPAIFDPSRATDSNRGLHNIVYLQHIWMDFEKGDLKPEEVSKLFPLTRLIVMNSFNHTNESPRFRVVFAVNQPLTPDVYMALWDVIADKFRDAGYKVRKRKSKENSHKPEGKRQLESGLDRSKRTPSSIFYLPCQAQNQTESFFIDCNAADREEIDAELWISRTHTSLDGNSEIEPCDKVTCNDVNQTRVQEATDRWRCQLITLEKADDGFFSLLWI